MFCSVTFVFLFGVLNITWGEELSDEMVTDETLAKQWLQKFKEKFIYVYNYESLDAGYNFSVDMTTNNKKLEDEANERYDEYVKWACESASRFDWKNFTDPSLKEWSGLNGTNDLNNFLCPRSPKEESQNFTSNETTTASPHTESGEVWNKVKSIYSNAQICIEDYGNGTASGNGSCIREIPGLLNLMAKSRDWDELLWAWKSWRDVTGKKMKKVLTENKITGCGHFGLNLDTNFGMTNFSSVCEDLWQQVKPLYQQLHAYVRRKLMDRYSNNTKDFPSTRQIPAHILGNIWAQQWGNIYDLVVPFPNSTVVNITKLLIDQGYDVLRMYREAESFFTSLGLPAMTPEFWSRSVLKKEKNDTRNFNCQPYCHTFYNGRDYRIKMCTEVTDFYYFDAIPKLMGCLQYYMNCKDLPLLSQEPVIPAFSQAVGDVIALSTMTPGHLRMINLLKDSTDDHESDMNFLIKIALEKVAFLPYGYLMDKYRWEIGNITFPEENCNKEYWKLRCGMQGISPPMSRSEEDFDPGAKFHVPSNWAYIGYFMSGIIQFQFHKGLCEAAGHVGPLHKCDIYNSRAAGDKLREMMSLGNTEPWPVAMEIITGQRNIDAGPLLEYFRPLQKWLKKENKGKVVGWNKECPVGSIQ